MFKKEAKIRFIIPKYPYLNIYSRIRMPPYGIMSVATSAAKKGYNVEVIDENNYNGKLDHLRLQLENPVDFVGFYGGITSIIPRLYELAKLYKEMGVITIAGGSHVNYLPEEALNSNVDYIISGEGEETFGELIYRLCQKSNLNNVKGVIYKKDNKIVFTGKREPITNLNKLPIIDFNLLKNLKNPINHYPVSLGRGCRFKCEFCVVNNFLGKTRFRNFKKAIQEIISLVEKGKKNFFFIDDNFVENKEEVTRLLKELIYFQKKKKIRLDFAVQVRADVAEHDGLLRLMKKAGISLLCIGYESIYNEVLNKMHKGLTVEKLESYTKILHDYGFYIHGMFILGYPGLELNKTISEQADDYIKFIKQNKIDTIQVLKPVPIPGTELRYRLEKEKRIYNLKLINWDKYDGNFVVFQPDCDEKELQDATTKIMRNFYNTKYYIKLFALPFISPIDLFYYTINKNYEEAKSIIKRKWRNTLIKIEGSKLFKEWLRKFKNENFYLKLSLARSTLMLQ
jgi:radical SAM superfamily enzyme YgiQ (UPF0313 family)